MNSYESYSHKRSFSNIHTESKGTANEYFQGNVFTPHGIVAVYSEKRYPIAIARFVHEGRLYRRRVKKAYSKLGLSRMANDLARDVVLNRTDEITDVKFVRTPSRFDFLINLLLKLAKKQAYVVDRGQEIEITYQKVDGK